MCDVIFVSFRTVAAQYWYADDSLQDYRVFQIFMGFSLSIFADSLFRCLQMFVRKHSERCGNLPVLALIDVP